MGFAFQGAKRKEKERYPGGVLTLLQRERDTKTDIRISSANALIKTLQNRTKLINDRALALAQIKRLIERRMTQTATTPLGIYRPP